MSVGGKFKAQAAVTALVPAPRRELCPEEQKPSTDSSL